MLIKHFLCFKLIINMDFKKGNKLYNGFFKSSEKYLWRRCFFWVAVQVGYQCLLIDLS